MNNGVVCSTGNLKNSSLRPVAKAVSPKFERSQLSFTNFPEMLCFQRLIIGSEKTDA